MNITNMKEKALKKQTGNFRFPILPVKRAAGLNKVRSTALYLEMTGDIYTIHLYIFTAY